MRMDRESIAETRAFACGFGSLARLDPEGSQGLSARESARRLYSSGCRAICAARISPFTCFQRAARTARLFGAMEFSSVFAFGFGSALFEGMPPSADAAAKLIERISPTS